MKTWIFQGTPDTFDIGGYLAASAGLIRWQVNRYSDQISVGDSVFIWRSGEEAGVVAEGTAVDVPRIQREDELSFDFWTQIPSAEEEKMRVNIRLNKIARQREILKRDWFKDDSILKNLLIMRQAAGTNFPVEPLEAQRLHQVWRKTGTDWGRDEVVAALYLYGELGNGPISKTAESGVEQLAQQIGRVPSGVYNKLMNLRSIDPRDSRKGFEGGSKVDKATWDEFFDTEAGAVDTLRLGLEHARLWGAGVQSGHHAADDVYNSEEKRLSTKSIERLLDQYARRPPNIAPTRRAHETVIYDRDPLVVVLRKRLAKYVCEVEGCASEQFADQDGELFVEVHHIIPLAAGGSDTLENTAAVCPTHHRFLHYGQDRESLAVKLTMLRHKEGTSVSSD